MQSRFHTKDKYTLTLEESNLKPLVIPSPLIPMTLSTSTFTSSVLTKMFYESIEI